MVADPACAEGWLRDHPPRLRDDWWVTPSLNAAPPVALVRTGHAQSTEPEIGEASSGRPTQGDLLTIIQTMETLPLADVKARLSELIARVQQQHDQVTVTRNGRPAAVVVSIDEWESLQETLEILSDPAAVAAIVEARDAVSRVRSSPPRTS